MSENILKDQPLSRKVDNFLLCQGRLLFHQRVPLIQVLLLVAFPLFGYGTALIGGVFDIRTSAGLLTITAINFMAIWVARTLFISIRDDAAVRFGITVPSSPKKKSWWGIRNVLWILAILVLPFRCLQEAFLADGHTWAWWRKVLCGGVGGIVVGYLLIWTALWLFMRYLADENDSADAEVISLPYGKNLLEAARKKGGLQRFPWFCNFESPLIWLAKHLGDGFLRKRPANNPDAPDRLTLGHRFALVIALKAEIIGLCLGFLAAKASSNVAWESFHFPTYLFLLLGINFFGLTMAFLAFTLDRWRIPTLIGITLLLLLLKVSRMDPTDHTFATGPLAQTTDEQKKASTPAVILLGAGSPEIPILVTAEGGGIHSGSWACHVLATLEMMDRSQNPTNPTFRNSIVCGSGVSGGSYGLMYWLDSYGDPKLAASSGNTDDYARRLYEITRGRAMRPSLDFAIRGLVYHDSRLLDSFRWKIIAGDRGAMLEQAWGRDLQRPDDADPTALHKDGLWLSDWTKDAAARKRPVALFNATSEERGLPVVFATSSLAPSPSGEETDPWHYHKWLINDDGQPYDVPITAAVRCSATFPYVAPAPRPAGVEQPSLAQHLVDGGYYDNTGVVSMVHWIRAAIGVPAQSSSSPASAAKGANFKKKIILIRILEADAATSDSTGQSSVKKGVLQQTFSPLTAIVSVRGKGHREEASSTLATLEREAAAQGYTIQHFDFVYPYSAQPLSWHLTRPQMHEIAQINFLGHEPPASSTQYPLPDISTEHWLPASEATTSREVEPVWKKTTAPANFTPKQGLNKLHEAAAAVLEALDSPTSTQK